MEQTRWLDDDEQRVWRSFITASGVLKEELDRQLQRDSGMPYGYYGILVALSEAPNRELRMSELACSSSASRSRLSHAVSRLEEAGWVNRRACPDDRRGTFAKLTDEGYRVLEQAAPGHVAAVREWLFDQLTPEQVRALGEISAAILEGFGASSENLPPMPPT
ncbi:DNA-binding MarR family transcriptional regulator [Herbihabitans rhizosphaerae]|uniref:DNA-binding MarR family transcriptional regulator n=1 Tax=Herbihabitans rhizosphaerae TaxID=1872711 RepID=A0A4Q7KGK1_9PSEU|nr:MarR family transcriptional regulator [Herbihabitans rhizosphaerae]RZS34382.1 DNA-binding MarR family transcriptional regulator [Herbihabitans rhizosphaerae]